MHTVAPAPEYKHICLFTIKLHMALLSDYKDWPKQTKVYLL